MLFIISISSQLNLKYLYISSFDYTRSNFGRGIHLHVDLDISCDIFLKDSIKLGNLHFKYDNNDSDFSLDVVLKDIYDLL